MINLKSLLKNKFVFGVNSAFKLGLDFNYYCVGDFDRWSLYAKDISKGNMSCRHVTSSLDLQLSYYMGFKEVYLLGVDCDYNNGHHFDGEQYSFQSKQSIYSDEYLNEVFMEYDIIDKEFKKSGRQVFNCSDGGKLESFERKNINVVIDV